MGCLCTPTQLGCRQGGELQLYKLPGEALATVSGTTGVACARGVWTVWTTYGAARPTRHLSQSHSVRKSSAIPALHVASGGRFPRAPTTCLLYTRSEKHSPSDQSSGGQRVRSSNGERKTTVTRVLVRRFAAFLHAVVPATACFCAFGIALATGAASGLAWPGERSLAHPTVGQPNQTPPTSRSKISTASTSEPQDESQDLCSGGMRPELDVRFDERTLVEHSSTEFTGVLRLENNTNSSVEVAYAVQVLDVSGADVIPPTIHEARPVPANGGADGSFELSVLSEGYYTVRATALTMVSSEPASPDEERVGIGEVRVRYENGRPKVVNFAEWYAHSGAESYGGQIFEETRK